MGSGPPVCDEEIGNGSLDESECSFDLDRFMRPMILKFVLNFPGMQRRRPNDVLEKGRGSCYAVKLGRIPRSNGPNNDLRYGF